MAYVSEKRDCFEYESLAKEKSHIDDVADYQGLI
jgi:hypothetical protein